MASDGALRVALQLLHAPSQSRLVRNNPLPQGVHEVLRIVANDSDALAAAARSTERTPDVIRQAAGFFIEQAMWHADADSFRVLGCSPTDSAADLKRNMTLLMVWLHPDVDSGNERAIFVNRVTAAWNDLKTPERRERYAAQLRAAPQRGRSKRAKPSSRGRAAENFRPHAAGNTRTKIPFMQRVLSFLLIRPPHNR